MSSSQGVVIASNQSPVSVSGTVIATPSGNQSVSGAITAPPGSVMAVFIASGSVAASFTPPANQSVSGTVVALMGGSWSASVQGSFSVIGTVPVTQAGAWSTSVVAVGNQSVSGAITAPPGSIMQIMGSVSGTVIATPTGNQSVSGATTAPPGSVQAVRTDAASVIAVSTNVGSVIAIIQAPSIVGTYAEDVTHATADRGIFTLGVRNDAVASFVGTNLDYSPIGTDSAGRTLTKPFSAEESRVEGYNSVVSGSVTTLVGAAGTGLRNYITDVMIANTGAATTLVTFSSGGGASILGYTIAPAGGGSNMTFQMPIRTLENQTFGFQATPSTSILFATVKGFKAP